MTQNKLMTCFISFATVSVLSLGAMPADAAPITFFAVDYPMPGVATNSKQAEAQFKASLGTFGADTNVDAYPSSLRYNPDLIFPTIGVTATTTGTSAMLNPGAVTCCNVLYNAMEDTVFTFNQAVQGFGTFLLFVGDSSGPTTLTFELANTVLGTSQTFDLGPFGPMTNLSAYSVMYLGLLDAANPFDRVTVYRSIRNDSFAYDDITVGFAPAAVPEPGTLALLVTGTVALFVRRRQIRHGK